MLRTNGGWFVKVGNNLSTLTSFTESQINAWGKVSEGLQQQSLETAQAHFVAVLNGIDDTCEFFKLPLTQELAKRMRLIELRGDAVSYLALIKKYTEELRDRFTDELKSRTIFVLAPGRENYYNPDIPIFGESVHDKFPSASFDILEAGNCFSVGRYTACVFHLMRALEIALKSLASVFRVETSHSNWQNSLDQVEKKIREMGTLSDKGENWKSDQEYYSQVVSHFRIIKDAWRNYTAHARGKYTDEEAEQLLRTTKSFMQHLAQRLTE